MRPNHAYESTDAEVVRTLIREHPWAILVSGSAGVGGGPVASHLPVLLAEEDGDDAKADGALAVVTHLGRPDDELHDLDGGELLLIVQGHHGYISPSWHACWRTSSDKWSGRLGLTLSTARGSRAARWAFAWRSRGFAASAS